jgi:hypothetical protein
MAQTFDDDFSRGKYGTPFLDAFCHKIGFPGSENRPIRSRDAWGFVSPHGTPI